MLARVLPRLVLLLVALSTMGMQCVWGAPLDGLSTQGITPAQCPRPQIMQKACIDFREITAVGFVDRVIIALPGHPDILVAENKSTYRRIQRKAMHAQTGTINQNRRSTIDHVTGGHLFAASL